jgi:hypothetical protein
MRFAGFGLLLLCASACLSLELAQNASDIDKIAEEGALTVTDIGADYGSTPDPDLAI